MKTLNECIDIYTKYLQHGEIQIAYRGILDLLGKLRSELINEYPGYSFSSIYQGYMDMSYFALSSKLLQDKGLKIAIVYLHEKETFEVWLSARNRNIAQKYSTIFALGILVDENLIHDSNNSDAIVEYVLKSMPDFDDQVSLISTMKQEVDKFISLIFKYLSAND